MYPYYYRLLSGLPSPSLSSLTLSGYSEASSKMTTNTDTERPELVGAWSNGRYYIGPPDGDAGEYLSAEATVDIEDAA